MVVEVVTGEIGEYAAGKFQSRYAALLGCMARNFHEGIVAAGRHHFGEKLVEGKRIGSGVCGRYGTVLDIVAHRRQKAGLVALEFCHLVE